MSHPIIHKETGKQHEYTLKYNGQEVSVAMNEHNPDQVLHHFQRVIAAIDIYQFNWKGAMHSPTQLKEIDKKIAKQPAKIYIQDEYSKPVV